MEIVVSARSPFPFVPSAVLVIVEVETAIEFDRRQTNAFDVLDAITVAVAAYRAATLPKSGGPEHMPEAASAEGTSGTAAGRDRATAVIHADDSGTATGLAIRKPKPLFPLDGLTVALPEADKLAARREAILGERWRARLTR